MARIRKLILSVGILLALSELLPYIACPTTAASENIVFANGDNFVIVSTDVYEFSFSKDLLHWNATRKGSWMSFMKFAKWRLYFNSTSVEAAGDEYNVTNGGHYWSNSTFEGGVFLNFTSASISVAPAVMEYFWFYPEYFIVQVNVTQTIPECVILLEKAQYIDDSASLLRIGDYSNTNSVSWGYGQRYQAQDVTDSESPIFIYSNKTDEGLAIAPIRPSWANHVEASQTNESDFRFLYELEADVMNADNITAMQSSQISFDKVFFQYTSADINQAFADYASLYSSMHALRSDKGSQSYWLTWYAGNGGGGGENVTEASVISNATWMETNLNSYYGFDGVLIDAIICDEVGDWLNYSSTRFPSGMAIVADRLHAMGFKAGLWIAPLMVEKDGWINSTHPEALARDKTGQLISGQMYFGQVRHDLYFLDPFNSWVQDRLRWVNENVSTWGFDFIKMDFLSAVLGELFEQNQTRYMVIEQALEAVTAGLDDKVVVTTHVGASYNPALLVNHIDRVWVYGPDLWAYSSDLQVQWESLLLKYDVVTNLIPFIRHFNLTVDSDALGRLSTQPPIPFPLVRFYSTYTTVGGGTFEIGEKLSTIDNETLEFYKKHLPLVPAKWEPVEWDSIFRSRPPRIWMYVDKKNEGQNYYIAVFNPEDSNRTIKIDFQNHLKLPPTTYLVMDQYSSTFAGEHNASIYISLGARETTVLTLIQKTMMPGFLMRSDHLTASANFISSLFNDGQLTVLFSGDPETLTTLSIFSPHEPVHVILNNTELAYFSKSDDFQTRNESCWYYDSAAELLYVKTVPRSLVTVVASFIDDVPPVVWNIERILEQPAYEQNVKIVVNTTDYHSSIGIVILSYSESSVEFNITMTRNDSSLYEAEIPANPYGTLIEYVVFVNDTWGNSVASESKSYTVTDNTAPEIGVLYHVPVEPLENQDVTVGAQVSEPSSGSGLETATLWFRTSGQWSSVTMTLQNGNVAAVIPGVPGNVTVEFFIEAFDRAGNRATTATSSYTTKPIDTQLSTILMYLAVVGLVAAFLLGTYYLHRFKRTSKRSIDISHQMEAQLWTFSVAPFGAP